MPDHTNRSPAERTGGRHNECALNPALHGCETFDFGPEDMATLRRQLDQFAAFSVHAPLPTPSDYPGSPSTSYLLDPDLEKRAASLHMLERTIEQAADWDAAYVVVHFGGMHSDGLTGQEIRGLADDAAAQINEWGARWDMPLHLEYAAYNPRFAAVEDLLDLVERYSHLFVCLDVGHLRIGAQMLGQDEWWMATALAPHTRSLHLWNTRGRDDVRRYHHVPVHPKLTSAEGWIDIPRMLDLVLRHDPDCAVVFEPHDAFNPSPQWQSEGIAWVTDIVAGYRSAAREQGGLLALPRNEE